MSCAPKHLHYTIEGQGPVIVLSHALGCDAGMWNEVSALLCSHYTIVRYDHRGHGGSTGGNSPFTIRDLADDAAALIQSLQRGAVHFAGVSMGGMTAQALAAHYPELLLSVTIANAASHYDAASRAGWQERIHTVQQHGMHAIAEGALQRWFSPTFLQTQAARIEQLRRTLLNTDPLAYSNACSAVAGIELTRSNPRIHCPALVIAGRYDLATPIAASETIAAAIPDARLVILEAAHIGCVEQPVAFAQLLNEHIQQAKARSSGPTISEPGCTLLVPR